jgi:hypothetical protein
MQFASKTCDWGILLESIVHCKFTNNVDIKQDLQLIKYIQHNVDEIENNVLVNWYTEVLRINCSLTIESGQRCFSQDQAPLKLQEIYKEIILQCPTDESIHNIVSLINRKKDRISGRTIDTLVTRYYKHHSVLYYLDITNMSEIKMVDYEYFLLNKQRKIILIDICSSYKNKMFQYSKKYFDCFSRGDYIYHTLHSGKIILLPICQFMFFLWVHTFKILDFLDTHYEKIVAIRRTSQQAAYVPKNKRKMVLTATNTH